MDPKFGSKSYNPNMDLKLDLDPEVTPQKTDLDWYSYGDKNLRW